MSCDVSGIFTFLHIKQIFLFNLEFFPNFPGQPQFATIFRRLKTFLYVLSFASIAAEILEMPKNFRHFQKMNFQEKPSPVISDEFSIFNKTYEYFNNSREKFIFQFQHKT